MLKEQKQLSIWFTQDQKSEDKILEEMSRLFRGDNRRVMQQSLRGYKPLHSGSLTRNDLRRHLHGDISSSIYLLDENGSCSTLCFDLDMPQNEIPTSYEEMKSKKIEELLPNIQKIIKFIIANGIKKENLLLEDTGGRGYHLWCFFDKPHSTKKILSFAYKVKRDSKLINLEIFPPNENHGLKGYSKSNMRLPLGLHVKYNSVRSVFLDLETFSKIPASDTGKHLESIKFISTTLIDRLYGEIETELLVEINKEYDEPVIEKKDSKQIFIGSAGDMLFLCPALSHLRAKAKIDGHLMHHERLALALTLNNLIDGEKFIHAIMQDCSDYSPNETQKQINSTLGYIQISCNRLQSQEYEVCGGWCSKELEKASQKGNSPTPLWFAKKWKAHEDISPNKSGSPIIDTVVSIDNLNQAWEQAKIQSKERDIFEDIQAYESFERNKWANLYILRSMLLSGEWHHQPFFTLGVPKKNEDIETVRPMCWANPWDTIATLAILNVIGPRIDSTFHENSLGNRLARGPKADGQIFTDWRKQNRYRELRQEGFSESDESYFYILTDISRFYEFIRHDRLMALLKEKGINDQKVLDIIQEFLEADWIISERENFQRTSSGQILGVPQGPALSAFLANLYLDDLDYWLENKAVDFVRYVDDFALLCENEEQAKALLQEMRGLLKQTYELELSDDPKKTQGPFSVNDTTHIKDWVRDARYSLVKHSRLAGSLTEVEKADMRIALSLVAGANLESKEEQERFLKYLGFYIATTERLEQKELQRGVYSLALFILNEKRPRHNATCIAIRALIKACTDFGEDAWNEIKNLLSERRDDYLRVIISQEARRLVEEHDENFFLYKDLKLMIEDEIYSTSIFSASAAIACLTSLGEVTSEKIVELHRLLVGNSPYLRPRVAKLLCGIGALTTTDIARIQPENGIEADLLLSVIGDIQNQVVIDSIAKKMSNSSFSSYAVTGLLLASLDTNSIYTMKICLQLPSFNSADILNRVCFYIAATFIDSIIKGEKTYMDLHAIIQTTIDGGLYSLAKQLYDIGRYEKLCSQSDRIDELFKSDNFDTPEKIVTQSLPRIPGVTLNEPILSINSRMWLHDATNENGEILYHEVMSDSEPQAFSQDIGPLLHAIKTFQLIGVLQLGEIAIQDRGESKYLLTTTPKIEGWQTLSEFIKSTNPNFDQISDIITKTENLLNKARQELKAHNLPDVFLPIPSCHTLIISHTGEVLFRNILSSLAGMKRYIGILSKPVTIPRESWDIYSLGLLFFELVTQRCAANILNSKKTIQLKECPESEAEGIVFKGIVAKATAIKPDSRYASTQFFLNDVKEWSILESKLQSHALGDPLKDRLRKLWHIELGIQRRMYVFAKEHEDIYSVSLKLTEHIISILNKIGEVQNEWLGHAVNKLEVGSNNHFHISSTQLIYSAKAIESQWIMLLKLDTIN